MRGAKRRTWTITVAAVVLSVLATACVAAENLGPPADVATVNSASPLLAPVDIFDMQARFQDLDAGADEIYVYGRGDYRLWAEDRRDGTRYVTHRGPSGEILRESRLDATSVRWMHERDLVIGAEGAAAAVYGDGSARYFHTDHLGTPRAITNDDGALLTKLHYYPYGLEIGGAPAPEPSAGLIFADGFESGDTSAWGQDFADREAKGELSSKFTGHQRDRHRQADYMLGRHYLFLVNRFASVDPARDGWNLYGYARNNPISFVDPDGFDVIYHCKRLERKFEKRAAKNPRVRKTLSHFAAGTGRDLNIREGDAGARHDSAPRAAYATIDWKRNIDAEVQAKMIEAYEQGGEEAANKVYEDGVVVTGAEIVIGSEASTTDIMHELGHVDHAVTEGTKASDEHNAAAGLPSGEAYNNSASERYADEYAQEAMRNDN